MFDFIIFATKSTVLKRYHSGVIYGSLCITPKNPLSYFYHIICMHLKDLWERFRKKKKTTENPKPDNRPVENA